MLQVIVEVGGLNVFYVPVRSIGAIADIAHMIAWFFLPLAMRPGAHNEFIGIGGLFLYCPIQVPATKAVLCVIKSAHNQGGNMIGDILHEIPGISLGPVLIIIGVSCQVLQKFDRIASQFQKIPVGAMLQEEGVIIVRMVFKRSRSNGGRLRSGLAETHVKFKAIQHHKGAIVMKVIA